MNMFRIGIDCIQLAIMMIGNPLHILFNPLPVFFRYQWQSVKRAKYKMRIQIIIFDFHNNKGIRVGFWCVWFSTKGENYK
jgi:hypothetical protein